MKNLRSRLSYANVTATLALIAAVGGGTVAVAGVAKAPKNSVVAKSIRNGNVTAKKLTTTVSVSAQASITDPAPQDGVYFPGSVMARCPKGARAIDGGGSSGGGRTVLQSSTPVGGNAWLIGAGSDSPSGSQISATVICLLATPGRPTEEP